MGIRQTALDMVDVCDQDYQAYVAVRSDEEDTEEARVAKAASLVSNASLLTHLMENFPNPSKMSDEQYDSLVAEVRGILFENKIDDLSDAAFAFLTIRTVMKDRKVVTFIQANNWVEFAKDYSSVAMGIGRVKS